MERQVLHGLAHMWNILLYIHLYSCVCVCVSDLNMKNVPHRLMCLDTCILRLQLVVLFEKAVEPLGDRVLLEKACHRVGFGIV